MSKTLTKKDVSGYLRNKWLEYNAKETDPEFQLALSPDEIEFIETTLSEYAKQEAIAFAEWIGKNDYIFYGGKDSTWYHSDDRRRKNPLTTELLFIQSKQQ